MNTTIEKLVEHFGDQVKTAIALGVTQPAVSQWISGSCRMSAVTALRAEAETRGAFKAADLCPGLRRAEKPTAGEPPVDHPKTAA